MEILEIIDSHQHFWDLERNYYPWLCDANPPHHRYGDQRAIMRNYLPPDHLAHFAACRLSDGTQCRLIGMVHNEANSNPPEPVVETQWLDELRHQTGMPDAAVARVDFEDDGAEAVIAAHARFPFVRGVRYRLRLGSASGRKTYFDNPQFLRAYASLEKLGLSCDFAVPFHCLPELAELAPRFPKVPIILNHCGNPFDRSPEGLAAWRSAMTLLAQAPHVSVKLSGIGVPGRAWNAELNAPIIRDALAIFGPDRCMFGSNFPVDSLVGDLTTIIRTTADVLAEMPSGAKEKVFRDNARRIYRLT